MSANSLASATAPVRLSELGCDLTAAARAGRLDPIVGRRAEITRVTRILSRKTKNNPILLGPPGVGKTAIVEGLAQRIVAGEVPFSLAGATLFSLNLGCLLAGTGYRGDFEKRMQGLIGELQRPGTKRILFIDEIHLLGQAGRSEGGLDAGNLLKPLLARGELPCIGASTAPEWAGLIGRDPALERRFQPVVVPEPSPAETVEILRGLRERYERHHAVEISDDALQAAVDVVPPDAESRRLPDRAVDLLDEACALLRLSAVQPASEDLVAARAELAVAEARFDLMAAARLRFRVIPALGRYDRPRVDAAAILRIAAERTPKPVG